MGKLVFCLLIAIASPLLLVLRMLPMRRGGNVPRKPFDYEQRNTRWWRVRG